MNWTLEVVTLPVTDVDRTRRSTSRSDSTPITTTP